MDYKVVSKKPVAKFYYKGHHSHYVRRTILVIKSDKYSITGYELRCGNNTYSLKKATIKTYLKSKIAKCSQIGPANHKEPGPDVSTLSRSNLLEILETGM